MGSMGRAHAGRMSQNAGDTMTGSQMLALLLGLALGAGGVLLVLRRRLAEAQARMHHLEASRQLEMQNTTAARRQNEALQQEVAELRHLMARRGVQVPARPAAAIESAPETTEPAALPADGFQATQFSPRSP